MISNWRLLLSGSNSAAINMAIDEAIMLRQREDALPTIRFYGWTNPSFSFGYFQKIQEAVDVQKCREQSVGLVRRPTGGGTVIHGWDLTYTVALPLENPLVPENTLESYHVIHNCLIEGLREHKIRAEHYSDKTAADEKLRNICLTNPTKYDVLIEGKKVAGAAQRRTRGVLLHQGYIALDMPSDEMMQLVSRYEDLSHYVTSSSTAINSIARSSLDRTEITKSIVSGFETVLKIKLIEEELNQNELDTVNKLIEMKYGTDKWNFR